MLVRQKVDVIAAPGSVLGALAAKAATASIPIVFSTSGDPVQLGLVSSLNRPNSNVTGFNDMSSELVPKMLGVLHELLPAAERFGVLVTRTNPWIAGLTDDAQSASESFRRQVNIFFANNDREIDATFAELAKTHVGALVVPTDVVLRGRLTQIVTLAARHAMPAIYNDRTWTNAGGLMSYGPFVHDQMRQAGIYTARILKGEKPADLPVMRATRFEFVINLATARAINLTVPPTLLASADEVIE